MKKGKILSLFVAVVVLAALFSMAGATTALANNWLTIETLNPTSDPDGLGHKPFSSGTGYKGIPEWVHHTIDLTEYANSEVQIRFYFYVEDGLFNDFRGWALDHIMLDGLFDDVESGNIGWTITNSHPTCGWDIRTIVDRNETPTHSWHYIDPTLMSYDVGASWGTLTSPIITLGANPTLEFDTWWEIESADPNRFDMMRVQINGLNLPPVLSGLPDKNLDEDTSLDNAIDLWSYASDLQTPVSDLAFTIVDNTNPDSGVSIDSNRYIDISPVANWYGSSDVTIQVEDPGNLKDMDTFTIIVNPVNDPPVAVQDSYSVDEDNTLSVPTPGVLTNDSDVDGDSLTAVLVSDVNNGTLALNADGSLSYTPKPHFNGADSFTYEAQDPSFANSNVTTVTITINPGGSDEWFVLSKNADFSTDDRDYTTADTLYIKVFSENIDHSQMKKTEWEIKVDKIKFKGNLTNNGNGTFTTSISLNHFRAGTGKVTIKLEDKNKNKFEVKDKPITIVAELGTEPSFVLSKNADFSTDDRDYMTTDTLYIKVFSENIDHSQMKKTEWKIKVNKTELKGNLTNNGNGTFTTSISLDRFSAGTGKVTIKLEDKNKNKFEVKDEPITIVVD